jgi:hypothetical protein
MESILIGLQLIATPLAVITTTATVALFGSAILSRVKVIAKKLA